MKIFNWVHRRFHNKENYAKKNGDIAADDKQFEVDGNKCNVLEHLRGGILTIGTFGYDVCDHMYEEHVVLSSHYENHDEIIDSEEEVGNDVDEKEDELEEYIMEMKMEESRREELGFEYVMMEKKARTTLADLFNADVKEQPLKKGDQLIKERSKCKHGLSFGKKLMLQETRHVRKVHRLIRRMLKRKIHPDISQVKVAVAKKCDYINDHASLLPTQEGAII